MTAPDRPWGLWSRQVAAVLRLELRKSYLGKRALPVYLLSVMLPLLLGLRAFAHLNGWTTESAATATLVFANLFQVLVLRLVAFFGCAWIFTNLFRGEILDRSLHYYFLAPIRRDVLATAKLVSGLVGATTFFVTSTAAALILLYVPYGSAVALDQLVGEGGGRTLAYLGVTALACLGYGAVFLATGLFFRNPFIPAVAVLGWESINFLLPPLLKKLTVIHYLLSLCPVTVSQGPFAILAEPTPAWISVPGLLLLTAAVLWIARGRIRRTEIAYGTD